MPTIIVLLYGLYHQDREKTYQRYLDWVADQIKSTPSRNVILCGGYTDPSRPDQSEASTCRDYLQMIVPDVHWILEDQSITTNQNLHLADTLLRQNNLQHTDLLVLGDRARQAKTAWLAMSILLQLDTATIYQQLLQFEANGNLAAPITYQNLTIQTFDYSASDPHLYLRQTYRTLLDVIPLLDPQLEPNAITQRRQDFGLD